MCKDCLSTGSIHLNFAGILRRADLRSANRCPGSLWMLMLLDMLDLLIIWLVAFVVAGIICHSSLWIDEIVSLLQQTVVVDYHPTASWTVRRLSSLLRQLLVVVHVDRVWLLAAMNDNFALLSLFLWAFTLIELCLGRLLLHTHLAIMVATRTFRVLRQTTATLVQYNVSLLGTRLLILFKRVWRLLNLSVAKLSRRRVASIIKHLREILLHEILESCGYRLTSVRL
jgi:hypothetical protein